MSELPQQTVFLKDLDQPFFLKELPSIVGEEPPIDVGHLARTSLGDRHLEYQVLELFDRQAEMLLSCMQEVVPAEVRSAAHMLARSAREIGAWRVAEAAEALEQAVVENRELASALWTLDCAVVEARLAICAMLRIQLSTRPTSRPSAAPLPNPSAQAREGRVGKGER
jgi:HPt (histidine-containing phosphotransfer) domain-containing protein